MQTIYKTLFFIITSAVYPLLVYVIVPWMNSFKDFRESTDAAGAGMAAGFAYYYGCLFSCIIWFVLSIILAHWYVRTWWIAFLALIVGLIAIFSINEYKDHRADNLLSPYTKYDEYGKIREEGHYIGRYGKENKHGKVTEYYPDGTVKSVETYERGEISGPYKSYYPNGKLMESGCFKGNTWNDGERIGIPDGNWTYYHKDGRMDDERIYAEGKLISSKNFTLYLDSAELICTIGTGKPFTGKLDKTGIVDEFPFPNLYTTQVKDGRCDGDFCSYYTIGDGLTVAATATYTDGKLNGSLKKYHTNGQLVTDAVYINGLAEGEYITYYTDSIAKRPHGEIKYTCSYKNGSRNGIARWYYENGILEEEAEYSAGKREGISRKYYPDGKPESIYTYHNGDRDGEFQLYNKDGSYDQKGSYVKDNISLREQYCDGTLRSVYRWRDGECIQRDNYDENGQLI